MNTINKATFTFSGKLGQDRDKLMVKIGGQNINILDKNNLKPIELKDGRKMECYIAENNLIVTWKRDKTGNYKVNILASEETGEGKVTNLGALKFTPKKGALSKVRQVEADGNIRILRLNNDMKSVIADAEKAEKTEKIDLKEIVKTSDADLERGYKLKIHTRTKFVTDLFRFEKKIKQNNPNDSNLEPEFWGPIHYNYSHDEVEGITNEEKQSLQILFEEFKRIKDGLASFREKFKERDASKPDATQIKDELIKNAEYKNKIQEAEKTAQDFCTALVAAIKKLREKKACDSSEDLNQTSIKSDASLDVDLDASRGPVDRGLNPIRGADLAAFTNAFGRKENWYDPSKASTLGEAADQAIEYLKGRNANTQNEIRVNEILKRALNCMKRVEAAKDPKTPLKISYDDLNKELDEVQKKLNDAPKVSWLTPSNRDDLLKALKKDWEGFKTSAKEAIKQSNSNQEVQVQKSLAGINYCEQELTRALNSIKNLPETPISRPDGVLATSYAQGMANLIANKNALEENLKIARAELGDVSKPNNVTSSNITRSDELINKCTEFISRNFNQQVRDLTANYNSQLVKVQEELMASHSSTQKEINTVKTQLKDLPDHTTGLDEENGKIYLERREEAMKHLISLEQHREKIANDSKNLGSDRLTRDLIDLKNQAEALLEVSIKLRNQLTDLQTFYKRIKEECAASVRQAQASNIAPTRPPKSFDLSNTFKTAFSKNEKWYVHPADESVVDAANQAMDFVLKCSQKEEEERAVNNTLTKTLDAMIEIEQVLNEHADPTSSNRVNPHILSLKLTEIQNQLNNYKEENISQNVGPDRKNLLLALQNDWSVFANSAEQKLKKLNENKAVQDAKIILRAKKLKDWMNTLYSDQLKPVSIAVNSLPNDNQKKSDWAAAVAAYNITLEEYLRALHGIESRTSLDHPEEYEQQIKNTEKQIKLMTKELKIIESDLNKPALRKN